MAYQCDKCFHNFSCSLDSVAVCNCCEDGSWFESVRNTETEEEGEEPPPFFSLSPSNAARGIYKINNSWGFFCAK
jgi:hypothetical protein